jgi:hypothetical protein
MISSQLKGFFSTQYEFRGYIKSMNIDDLTLPVEDIIPLSTHYFRRWSWNRAATFHLRAKREDLILILPFIKDGMRQARMTAIMTRPFPKQTSADKDFGKSGAFLHTIDRPFWKDR